MKILMTSVFFKKKILLGGYDKEEKAARAYDLAALKYWGSTTTTNFPVTSFSKSSLQFILFYSILITKKIAFSLDFQLREGTRRDEEHD